MRKGEHVELIKEITREVRTYMRESPSTRPLEFYLLSYLPIISDSLASIADSLEILTKDLEEKENKT